MSEDNVSWVPQPGDTIKGRVVDIRAADGGYGPYPLLVIDTGETEVPVHAYHSVLRGELAKRRPKVGDELGITYVGQVEPKSGGRPYHSYRVTGGQVSGGYDWSQDLPEGARQVTPDIPVEVPEPVAVAPDVSDLPF